MGESGQQRHDARAVAPASSANQLLYPLVGQAEQLSCVTETDTLVHERRCRRTRLFLGILTFALGALARAPTSLHDGPKISRKANGLLDHRLFRPIDPEAQRLTKTAASVLERSSVRV